MDVPISAGSASRKPTGRILEPLGYAQDIQDDFPVTSGADDDDIHTVVIGLSRGFTAIPDHQTSFCACVLDNADEFFRVRGDGRPVALAHCISRDERRRCADTDCSRL